MYENIESVFDSFFKKVLKNAAIDFQIKREKLANKEVSLEVLVDNKIKNFGFYPVYEVECKRYRVLGCDIFIEDENLIKVFDSLNDEQINIILLYYYLDMRDKAIAKLLNKSRACINSNRLKTLKK